MSIPPGSQEYPEVKCPGCGKIYTLTQLDVDNSQDSPVYYCPNCDTQIYQPDGEE